MSDVYDTDDKGDFASLEGLSPQERQALLGLSTQDAESAIIQRQLAQAEALKKGSGHQYHTGGGALLGGIGDVLSAFKGSIKEERALQAQRDLIAGQQAGMGARMHLGNMKPQGWAPYTPPMHAEAAPQPGATEAPPEGPDARAMAPQQQPQQPGQDTQALVAALLRKKGINPFPDEEG